jgi:hypothetical protein
MLEAGVEMRFFTECHDLVEVRVVDVRVDAEQALEDRLHHALEVLREGHVDARREDALIVELSLHPRHKKINVLWRTALHGLLVAVVRPQVFVLWTSAHYRTRRRSAELGDAAVKQVELIEEIDSVDSEPFVKVFALRQFHGHAQITRAECRLGLFVKTVALRSLVVLFIRPKGFAIVLVTKLFIRGHLQKDGAGESDG